MSSLTDAFVMALKGELKRTQSLCSMDYLIQVYPEDFVSQGLTTISSDDDLATKSPLVFIGFSAGVIGAIASATVQQQLGHPVLGLIALDGWGVPLVGHFPIYRLSHDEFTHQTTAHWGGERCFYADPPVAHLSLWGTSGSVTGWYLKNDQRFSVTALQCLVMLIHELAKMSVILGSPSQP